MNIYFISELADKALIDYLNTKGPVIPMPKDDRFDNRISSHPDLVISVIDDTLIIDENASDQIFGQLDALGVPYVMGSSALSAVYPQDIAYNAVITKDCLLHKLNHTNSLLLEHSRYMDKKLIPVRQGYTKCSTVVVSDDAIITADQGIYSKANDFLKVLLIQPGHVLLGGFEAGFLGGASGLAGDTVVFHGDLSKHPDFLKIKSFIEASNKKLHYFEEFPLTDIGSILEYRYPKDSNRDRAINGTNRYTPNYPDALQSNVQYRKHVNIPVFISHEGCPNDCVFCNQRKITAKPRPMTLPEVSEQVETYCSTLDADTDIELAFFGGSFTGIDPILQESYLKLAAEYKNSGKIQAIRLSTRPDYISREVLDRLKHYQVDIIELGVQSLDPEVLKASNRGHQVSDVYQAVKLIRSYGFQFGIQLMVGLPEDTKERSVHSSKLTALLRPDFVRIYPTLVIRETELAELCSQDKYHPLSIEEAVDWTKEMYLVFLKAQIPVIRIGLQPTDLIAEGKEVLAGPFHPAFRQLVESAYFLEVIRNKLGTRGSDSDRNRQITILCNPKDLSQVIGHKRFNILELQRDHPHLKIVSSEGIPPMTIEMISEV